MGGEGSVDQASRPYRCIWWQWCRQISCYVMTESFSLFIVHVTIIVFFCFFLSPTILWACTVQSLVVTAGSNFQTKMIFDQDFFIVVYIDHI